MEERIEELERRIRNLEDNQAQMSTSIVDIKNSLTFQSSKLDKMDMRITDFQQFLSDHAQALLGSFMDLEQRITKSIECVKCPFEHMKE